jgi:hypothetical protein
MTASCAVKPLARSLDVCRSRAASIYVALRLLGAIACIGPLWLPAPAVADSPRLRAEMTRVLSDELAKQFGTRAQLDAAVAKTYGVDLSPEKARVARDFLQSILFHEGMSAYFAEVITPLVGPKTTRNDLVTAAFEGVQQLQMQGLLRLPTERQAAFIRHTLSMVRSLPTSMCKAMFLSQVDGPGMARMERRYIANLPLGKFEAVTNLYKQAVVAQLTGYPDVRQLNAQQVQLAEKVYADALDKRTTTRFPRAVSQRIYANPAEADASEVCVVMSMTLEALLDLREPYRTWQLTRFIQSIQ